MFILFSDVLPEHSLALQTTWIHVCNQELDFFFLKILGSDVLGLFLYAEPHVYALQTPHPSAPVVFPQL